MELGIGTGIAQFDFDAMGVERWSIDERTERFAEYVQLIDQLLRNNSRPISVKGRYYETVDSLISPPTPQRPRPPITVGGQSLPVLRVAVAHGDCWNSDGHPHRSVQEIYNATRDQTKVLDDLCRSVDRDPRSLRRSLLLIHQLDAWANSNSLERMVKMFWELGVQEYSMFWPGDDRLDDVRRAALEVIPRLRRELR
jgi:alkanesulfonate monooxygenase SsuD/methylene tetrahydromethanopterin reductase-like flavin-dependent oxidoreductase (luciferase family)